MLEKGDLVTLNNEKQYVVVDQLKYKGKNYLFLSSKDGISDISIFLFENDDLKVIKDVELYKALLSIFNEKVVIE